MNRSIRDLGTTLRFLIFRTAGGFHEPIEKGSRKVAPCQVLGGGLQK